MLDFGGKIRLESCCHPPVLCMDELAQSLNNSVTVSQGAGQPFREIAKRLLPLTQRRLARQWVPMVGVTIPRPSFCSNALLTVASLCVSWRCVGARLMRCARDGQWWVSDARRPCWASRKGGLPPKVQRRTTIPWSDFPSGFFQGAGAGGVRPAYFLSKGIPEGIQTVGIQESKKKKKP